MDSHNILSLLGLSLRGGNLVVGEEPVDAAARARDARVLLLASDAAAGTRRRCEHFAAAGDCLWLPIPFTKAELGRAVGRTSVAIVAVTDIGLANAVVRRLAELDPVRYDEAAAKMELKAQRAAERKAEQAAHEKNLRWGKRRAPAEAEPPKAPAKAQAAPPEKPRRSRPPRGQRPKPKGKTDRYAHSRPVKKGKGSFRKKDG